MIIEGNGTLKPLNPEYVREDADEYGEYNELRHPYRVIHYYYPIAEIADEVYKRTSVIGRTRSTKDGAPLMPDIALTPDEREVFISYCRNAATDVFEVMLPFVNDNTISFVFDEDTADDTKHSVHYIIRHPEWVMDNSVHITDRRIFEAIVANVVAEWFLSVYPEEAQIRMSMADNAVRTLKTSLNSHRRMSVVSHPF